MMVAGSVTVLDNGTLDPGSSGLALLLFNAFSDANIDSFGAAPNLANARFYAAQANRLAVALVGFLNVNVDVKIPKDSLDTGVPSVDRTLTGALE